MSNTIRVLDHGFVTLRNLAGPTRRRTTFVPEPYDIEQGGYYPARPFDADDTDVANAARMSFEGQDKERSYEVEMKLNRYLMKNKHMTPFEAIEVWLEMKLPIFVARQFVRHRTAALNEVSGRYVTLPGDWYIPETVGAAPTDKKQGQAEGLDLHTQSWFKRQLHDACSHDYSLYLEAISKGVAPEHARMLLHLNHYTHWLWKQDLRNMFGFLLLRDHGHAQKEAQAYAQAITQLLEPHIPGLMQVYREIMRGEQL